MIELASPAEIIALKLEWEKEQEQRYTKPEYEREIEQMQTYAEERKSALQLIAENYKKSEEKRIGKIVARYAARKAKREAGEKAENERWDKIFKEKFEDKSYYAR